MTKFSLKAVKLVQRFRYVIPIVWLVLAIIGGYLTPLFVKGTNNALGTPKNTPSQLTEQKIAHFYPDLGSFGGGDSLTLFLWSKQTPPQDIFKQFDLKTFTEQLETKAKQYNQTKDIVVEINGYYVMLEKGFGQEAADAFRSKNNDSTILPISTNKGMHQFYPYLVKIVEEITPANSTLKLGVQIMGTDAFMETIQNSVEIDMARGDGIVVPLAFIILGYMIGSARLLILPLVSLICCGLTSFGLMYFATLSMHVMSTTLSLMMSVTIALTIDYSLFTLTRLREELTQKRGISMEEAVANTLAGAGHTIIVSGLTLFFAFVGLLIIPITTVRSLGTGCAVAVCIILLANVTLVPAILLSFPNFFRRSIEPCAWPCSRAQSNDDEFDAEAFLEQDQKLTLSGNLEDWMTEDDIKDERNRCGCSWLCMAQKLVKPPFNIISVICVVLFTAPLAYPAVTFTANDSAVLAMPRGAALTDAFQEMNRQFGFGYLNPYTILISSKHPNTTVLSESFWNASHTLINTMSNELYDTPTTGFSGISWASGRDIPLPIVQLCVETNQAKRQLDICGALKDEYNRTVSPTNDAAMFTLLLKFDPNSGVGYDWYKQCLLLFKRLNLQQKDWVFDITGGAAPGWDSVTLAYSYFPVMIGVTASIILALVGFALKSVVIPLRSLLGIALTLSFAYGMATVVYQYGWLDWMGFWGLHSYEHEQSILWLPPLVSFSICVGLMLDYDVLLLIRVADYRYSGVPHRLSVIKGVAKTGGIITAAGAIMAVAFSGLLFSNSPAMNQLSFYLVAAVLYDTFVVRTFLIPALMSLTGDVSWWPGIRKGHQPAIKQPKPFSLN